MPVARIVTSAPESVAALAEYLTRRGYTVEIFGPDEIYESAAELEITVDTCAREQAQERAAQLANQIGADVVLAPGVLPAKTLSIAEQPAVLPKTVEETPPSRESILAKSQAVTTTLGAWTRRAQAATAATTRHFRNLVHEQSRKGSVLAAKWLKISAQSARQLWVRARLNAGKAVSAGRTRIHEARVQAVARAHARVEMQARRRELARAQALSQAQLTSAEAAPSAAQIDDREEEVATIKTPNVVAHRPAPARSSLVAYTRNRDWKMAFIGATAASLLIMVVSFEFVSALPPEHDVEQTQTLPLGAVTVQPDPPALIDPATSPEPLVAPAASLAEKARSVLKVEPVTTVASQAEPGEEEYADEEVVIRHYPAGDSIKARIGADGVKRISDQD